MPITLVEVYQLLREVAQEALQAECTVQRLTQQVQALEAELQVYRDEASFPEASTQE